MKNRSTKNKNKNNRKERRKEERIPAEIEVKYSTGESFVADWTTNISRGGMFIRTLNPLPPGTRVRISFSIPESQEEIKAEGIVRWKADPSDPVVIPGMGIEIINMDEKSRKNLDEFLKKILQQKKL